MHKFSFEYIKYDEKMSPADRRDHEHRCAYELLYKMLKAHFSLDRPQILKTENGKPYVQIGGVHFSVSHTDGLVACAVADSPVGIDCEKIKERKKEDICRFAKRFFVENELKIIEASGFDSKEFFKLWTGKEATIKKLGTNMSDIKKIDVTRENVEFFIENDYIIAINV